MIAEAFLWSLLIPLVIGAWFFYRYPRIWPAHLGFGAVSVLVIAICVLASVGFKTMDTEIISGEVTSKKRIHDDYLEWYDCHCRTNSKKERVCQRCSRKHYTVDWKAYTTIGTYGIKSLDETSRRVYDEPDPAEYTKIWTTQPVAKESPYVNYVQAAEFSLFNEAAKGTENKFPGMIPAYPSVFGRWDVNRVLSVGVPVQNLDQWNLELAKLQRVIGPAKQVNVSIVFVNTKDPSYEYSLIAGWAGLNKNDVVVIIGSTQYPKIDWVRIASWTKREDFKLYLRRDLEERGTIQPDLITIIAKNVNSHFERRKMKEFAYLKAEISPSSTALMVMIGLLIALAVGYEILIRKNLRYSF